MRYATSGYVDNPQADFVVLEPPKHLLQIAFSIAICGMYVWQENPFHEEGRRVRRPYARPTRRPAGYCTAFTMSKIGRYIATTIPPTITPSTTIMMGSSRESSALTAASTSSS